MKNKLEGKHDSDRKSTIFKIIFIIEIKVMKVQKKLKIYSKSRY